MEKVRPSIWGAESRMYWGIKVETKANSAVKNALEAFRAGVKSGIHSLALDVGYPFTVTVSLLGGYIKAEESLDSRLQKIDQARRNLSDALGALDELSKQATQNRADLECLKSSIEAANQQKAAATAAADTAKHMAQLDATAVRSALGMPNALQRWIERGMGFVIGILASLVASWVYGKFWP